MRVVFPLIMTAPPVDPAAWGGPSDVVPAASWSWPLDAGRPSCPAGTARPLVDTGDHGATGGMRSGIPVERCTRRIMATKVGVVGCGIMGSGIAEVSARAG